MAISAKLKKTINYALRIVIAAAALWFIYKQLTDADNWQSFKDTVTSRLNSTSFRFQVFIVLLLMPVNWGIESYKWRMLIAYVERITFKHAMLSVFTGITMSLFTPNRIGEFFARLLTLKKAPLMKGAFLTITGSISQLLTTLLFGMLALCIFIPSYYSLSETRNYLIWLLVCITCGFAGITMVMMYLRVPGIYRLTTVFVKPGWEKIRGYLRVIRRLKRRLLLKVLLLSISRYLVFSTQFFLMLLAFGLPIDWFNAFILISMTYFTMTAIPTIALVDLGIRGSVSIYFLGLYFSGVAGASVSILAATTAVWIVNMALPAIIGLIFIYRINIIRKEA